MGRQQHGHIAGIGFAAYCKLLEETISSLRGETVEQQVRPEPVLEMNMEAYIPDSYIDNPRYKLELYRRLGEMTYEEKDDLLDEIMDRFGQCPEEVITLWRISVLKALCRELGIEGISVGKKEIRIRFGENSMAAPEALTALVRDNVPFVQIKNVAATQLVAHKQCWQEEPLAWLEKALKSMV